MSNYTPGGGTNEWTPDSLIQFIVDWPAFKKQWPDGLRSFNLVISQPSDDAISIACYTRVQLDSSTIAEYNVLVPMEFLTPGGGPKGGP